MRHKCFLLTAQAVCATVCVALLFTLDLTAQTRQGGADVTARDVSQLTSALVLSTDVDLQRVQSSLDKLRMTLSRSQVARERLYRKVGDPPDDFIRFKHLEKLACALCEHAETAARSRELPRALSALDLAAQVMILIATAPAPPRKLKLDAHTEVRGEMVAGEPVWALRAASFNLTAAIQKMQEVLPDNRTTLNSLAVQAAMASLAVSEATVQQRLKDLLNRGAYKDFAQECARLRAAAAQQLQLFRHEVQRVRIKVKR